MLACEITVLPVRIEGNGTHRKLMRLGPHQHGPFRVHLDGVERRQTLREAVDQGVDIGVGVGIATGAIGAEEDLVPRQAEKVRGQADSVGSPRRRG